MQKKLYKIDLIKNCEVLFPLKEKTFKDFYADSIRKNSSRPFITAISATGLKQCIQFEEFDFLVTSFKSKLEDHPLKNIVILPVGNNVENLAFMTALWLTNRIVFPFPEETTADDIKRKVKDLNLSYSVVLNVSDFNYFNVEQPENKPEEFFPSRDFVYILTSGSTGYSKIVRQHEIGIIANALSLIKHHQLGIDITIGTPLPISHVNALEFSFLCSLFSGAHLVLFEKYNFQQVLETISSEKIQILSVVPHILKNFSDRARGLTRTQLLPLKYFVSAASALPQNIAKNIYENLHVPIIQGYGLSEAVNFSASMPIDLSAEKYQNWMFDHKYCSIGIPLLCNELVILDESNQTLGPDTEGQIGIRGPNIMQGYFGVSRDEYIKNDYLLTGDRGFYLRSEESQENFYFITKRQKDVIKKFGLTISLREVDDIVSGFRANTECDIIAVGFDNIYSGEDVALIVSSKSTTEFDLKRFQSFIDDNLGSSLRPRVFLYTEKLLRTNSGKPLRWVFSRLITDKYLKTMFTQNLVIDAQLLA